MSGGTKCKQLPFLLPSSVPLPCPPRRRRDQGVWTQILPLFATGKERGGGRGGEEVGGPPPPPGFKGNVLLELQGGWGRPMGQGPCDPVLTSLRLLGALTGTQQALCFFPQVVHCTPLLRRLTGLSQQRVVALPQSGYDRVARFTPHSLWGCSQQAEHRKVGLRSRGEALPARTPASVRPQRASAGPQLTLTECRGGGGWTAGAAGVSRTAMNNKGQSGSSARRPRSNSLGAWGQHRVQGSTGCQG